jgi:LmbE family N-acetylglucosaminyl deacetylase
MILAYLAHQLDEQATHAPFDLVGLIMHQKSVTVDKLLSGSLLVIAPHMDDEILGCGGLMLLHEDKRRLHCIYASDGTKSPAPLLPWQGAPDKDIAQIRERESGEALAEIGVPPENAILLGLPDGGLSRASGELRSRLEQDINRIRPDFIFVPFRYDLHADHVAVHRAVRALKRDDRISGTVLEYFIYFRWRLVRGGDVRVRIPKARLMKVDITSVSSRKRRALSMYRSQTSIMYSWQESPILTDISIRQRCREPEYFLFSDAAEPLLACFSANRAWLLFAHFVERLGKRKKDQLVAFCKWVLHPFLRLAG